MLQDLTLDQLQEWEAFNRIQPIGDWRQDYRIAMLTSIVTNFVNAIYCKKGTTPKEVTPLDFMPDWGGGRKVTKGKQTVEQMKGIVLNLAGMNFPKINKKRGIEPPPRRRKKRR